MSTAFKRLYKSGSVQAWYVYMYKHILYKLFWTSYYIGPLITVQPNSLKNYIIFDKNSRGLKFFGEPTRTDWNVFFFFFLKSQQSQLGISTIQEPIVHRTLMYLWTLRKTNHCCKDFQLPEIFFWFCFTKFLVVFKFLLKIKRAVIP